ncbi:hypothetical protein J7K07_02380, partial [Candidatus Bathyarchaeota archaeon]|nr:hypothetical protein [Candidatus Bathyarchaeota archaeon]
MKESFVSLTSIMIIGTPYLAFLASEGIKKTVCLQYRRTKTIMDFKTVSEMSLMLVDSMSEKSEEEGFTPLPFIMGG